MNHVGKFLFIGKDGATPIYISKYVGLAASFDLVSDKGAFKLTIEPGNYVLYRFGERVPFSIELDKGDIARRGLTILGSYDDKHLQAFEDKNELTKVAI